MVDFNGTCPINASDICNIDICPLECAQVQYFPSLPANAFFAGVFGLAMIAQILLGVWYKTWGFMVAMICGLILEVIGYVGRIMLHDDPFDFNNFLIYLVPLTIGPAFLTAGIYLCLSRIIIAHSVQISRCAPKWISLSFMTSDFIALVLQAAGGALASTADDEEGSDAGINTMIAGLVWQVVSLGVYLLLWGDFAWRLRGAAESQKSQSSALKNLRTGSKRFQYFQYALLLATILVFIRSVYRVVELAGGFDGEVANHQSTFIVFESVTIIIAALLLTVLHPGVSFEGHWADAGWSFKKNRNVDGDFELSKA